MLLPVNAGEEYVVQDNLDMHIFCMSQTILIPCSVDCQLVPYMKLNRGAWCVLMVCKWKAPLSEKERVRPDWTRSDKTTSSQAEVKPGVLSFTRKFAAARFPGTTG